jgi:hypothetical protein
MVDPIFYQSVVALKPTARGFAIGSVSLGSLRNPTEQQNTSLNFSQEIINI